MHFCVNSIIQTGSTSSVPKKHKVGQGRLGVLDGLRGIAVLLVVWYHIWQISWLPAPLPWMQFIPETGFEGVDLFFYISGFVIAYPFIKAMVSGEAARGWGYFAYRRAMKIVPSYLLSIVVVIAIGYAHFANAGQALRDIAAHLLFIHTWSYDTYGSINGVLWTLGVEVQFYVLFPFLWAVFKQYPWLTAGAMTAVSVLYRTHAAQCCLHDWMQLLVFNLPGYLDIFAAGMISALLYVRWRNVKLPWLPAIATLAAAGGFALFTLLLQQLWAIRTQSDWPTLWQIDNRTFVGFAFLLMGLGSLLAAPAWQRALASPVLLFLGAISYNLYLYHQVLARLIAKLHLAPVPYTLAALAAGIVAATLLTYLFERPLLRIPADRWRTLVSRKRAAGALSEV